MLFRSCSVLKCETVHDTLDATAKVPRHAGLPRGEHRGSRYFGHLMQRTDTFEKTLMLGKIEGGRMLSHFSHVQLFVTLWTVTCQAPLSMGFSRQVYWNGLPRSPPGDLRDPGIEHIRSLLCLLRWQAGYLPLVPPGKPKDLVLSRARL